MCKALSKMDEGLLLRVIDKLNEGLKELVDNNGNKYTGKRCSVGVCDSRDMLDSADSIWLGVHGGLRYLRLKRESGNFKVKDDTAKLSWVTDDILSLIQEGVDNIKMPIKELSFVIDKPVSGFLLDSSYDGLENECLVITK